MAKRVDISVELRGQQVTCDCGIVRADESVGMMGDSVEDVCVYDADGKALDWELTDEELQILADRLPAYEHDVDE